MTAKTFEELLSDIKKQGGALTRSEKSMQWLQDYVRQFGGKTRDKLAKGNLTAGELMRNNPDNLVNKFKLGKMVMFFYDPKLRDTLPYYDRFPCVFPFAPKKGENNVNGFLGLNLHYLPPELRAKLFDNLVNFENNARLTKNKKLELSYELISQASNFWKPCLKHYLNPHVKSRFLEVPYEAWPLAMLLPLAQFEGKSVIDIYNESKKMVK